jgi:hypothetical protein
MTRSYAAARAGRITKPLVLPRVRPPRDATITPLGFTCFRLMRTYDAGGPPFIAIEKRDRRNAMSVLASR